VSEREFKPHVTVAAVVEVDGRFLVVEETAGGRRVLNQPAGHLERGESITDAVVRETLEEAAVDIEPTALIAVYRWAHPTRDRTFVRFTFAARVLRQHRGRALDDGIHRALWLTREELAARPARLRSPMVLRSIDDSRDGPGYPLSLLRELTGPAGDT